MCRTRYSSTYSEQSGTISWAPHWAHLITAVSFCMDSPRVTSWLFRSGASPIVELQDLKCACLDCYVLNRMSALLPARRGKLYPLRAPKKSFALRSNPVSIFEQVKTETIRYHTLLQTALTYLKELAPFDPDCCLGPPRCVYPRACQVGTSLSQQYPSFVHVRWSISRTTSCPRNRCRNRQVCFWSGSRWTLNCACGCAIAKITANTKAAAPGWQA